MNVTWNYQFGNLVDYDRNVQLPLKTSQRGLVRYDVSTARIDESFPSSIEKNAMTQGGVGLPPDDHNRILFHTFRIRTELPVFSSMGFESKFLELSVCHLFHRVCPEPM